MQQNFDYMSKSQPNSFIIYEIYNETIRLDLWTFTNFKSHVYRRNSSFGIMSGVYYASGEQLLLQVPVNRNRNYEFSRDQS